MSAYRHFRFSLQAEFKRQVYRQVHALRADLEELKEAMDDTDRTVILRQVHQRICALERATYAVEAHEVRVVGKPRMRRFGVTRTCLATLRLT